MHWPPVAEHYYHPQNMAARTSLKPRARFELPAHDHELLLAGVRRPSTIPAGRNRAKLLLAHSDMSIETVAHHSGFLSFTNLARVFRRETGETPRNYRIAHRLARHGEAEWNVESVLEGAGPLDE